MGFLAALTWIVRHEGSAYRRTLERRRKATASALEETAPRAADHAKSDRKTEGSDLAAGSSRKAGTEKERVIDAPTRVRTPEAIARAEAKADVGDSPPAKGNPPVDSRRPDLRGLSPEGIRALGDELYQRITQNHSIMDDPGRIQRLEACLRRLSDGGLRPSEPIRFHLLDSSEVNAFSHIGGHLYVSRGVFSLAQTDAELEFVVAHELAHAELGHPGARLEQVVREVGARCGLVPTLHHLIALGYSDEQEYQADDRAYQILRSVDRSHREAVGFLRHYTGYAERNELKGHRPPRTPCGDPRQDVENHYPAHPPARERHARLKAKGESVRGPSR